jgi:hypothetical protein
VLENLALILGGMGLCFGALIAGVVARHFGGGR